MSKELNWFELKLNVELPRTITRDEWYAIQHWLRTCRRLVAMKVVPVNLWGVE